jgi:uncharacterized phiE125 gp8 family phage protein
MRVSQLITKPAREPLTLAEAKLHRRVDDDHTDDDALIAEFIVRARRRAENYTHRALITQTWESRFNYFSGWMLLPHGSLQSVESVKYIDSNGTEQTVAASVYELDTFSPLGGVYLGYSQTWPSPRVEPQAVRIRFVCGYGAYGSDVPEEIRGAMHLMIGDMYENRETGGVGTVAFEYKTSATIEAMLGPYRIAMP